MGGGMNGDGLPPQGEEVLISPSMKPPTIGIIIHALHKYVVKGMKKKHDAKALQRFHDIRLWLDEQIKDEGFISLPEWPFVCYADGTPYDFGENVPVEPHPNPRGR